MDQNQFLRDFIKMRQELRNKQATYAPTPARNAPSPALRAVAQPSGMTLATIIETKPPKSDIVKYLRHKLDMLMEEMSD